VPLVSDPPIIAAVLSLLSQVPPGLLRGLQICGGLLVLWLGATGLRAVLRPPVAHPQRGREAPRGFWRAVLVNLTNPNAWIGWSLVLGPTIADAWRAAPARALAFLSGFYLLLVGGNAALVLGFGAAGRLGPEPSRVLGTLSAAALLVFGAWQVGRGVLGT
jgi:threonine/homoserine/homoserine lactone efflux protein